MLIRLTLNRGHYISALPLLCHHGPVSRGSTLGLSVVNHRFKSTQKSSNEEEIDLDAPIKFSTSRAATWKSRETYGSKQTELTQRPWYEPVVVTLSTAVFLLYFCYLREESNVDEKFSMTLYDHISGLEEKQLELSLQHNIETGQDTKAIRDRLAELRAAKTKEEEEEES